jgi:hypothetical protein
MAGHTAIPTQVGRKSMRVKRAWMAARFRVAGSVGHRCAKAAALSITAFRAVIDEE